MNEFLRILYIYPYAERKDRNNKRIKRTCNWFTKHHLFNHWRNNIYLNLLWVSVDPGCGKSVLSRYLIDKVFLTFNTIICYFFSKDNFINQRSSANAVYALLRQLLLQKPDLLKDSVLNKFNADGDKFI